VHFEARVLDEIEYRPDAWHGLRVGVFEIDASGTERMIGEYERDYPNLFHTFFGFRVGAAWFALYSPDYTRNIS